MKLLPKSMCAYGMRAGLCVALVATLLAGCAHQAPPAASGLLHDALYAPPAVAIDSQRVFAFSDAMRHYAETELAAAAAQSDPRRALIEALYRRTGLRLRYDAGNTRTAAEAFDDRAGNCLSLVIMTAAFAHHLGLPVSFRSVTVETLYSRSGDLVLASGHVNLVLDHLGAQDMADRERVEDLLIDFVPGADLRGQRTRPLQEATIVAMYMNNRAAESLAAGALADSYWWARQALLQDPGFDAAANTLAVVYLRGGHLDEAEAALRHVLARDPGSTSALSNLALVLQRAGRSDEARAVQARLAQLQPLPPFHDYELGRLAMAGGAYGRALELFERELRRQPDQPEVHFWAAQASWRLGDAAAAAQHLRAAIDYSPTPGEQALYAAKLDWLRAHALQ